VGDGEKESDEEDEEGVEDCNLKCSKSICAAVVLCVY
jgi:hypothetical protein